MKKFFYTTLTLVATLFATSCTMDIPSVTFSQDSYLIPASGGEIIIPVRNTGIDNVTISYSDNDNWEIDDNGDMIPTHGWIEVVKVIHDYKTTRTLESYNSGIVLRVAPHTGDYERRATLTVTSYSAADYLNISQSAPLK